MHELSNEHSEASGASLYARVYNVSGGECLGDASPVHIDALNDAVSSARLCFGDYGNVLGDGASAVPALLGFGFDHFGAPRAFDLAFLDELLQWDDGLLRLRRRVVLLPQRVDAFGDLARSGMQVSLRDQDAGVAQEHADVL